MRGDTFGHASRLEAVAHGDRWAVTWEHQNFEASDVGHVQGRTFDGAALGDTVTLAESDWFVEGGPLTADSAGRAFVVAYGPEKPYASPQSGKRFLVDLAGDAGFEEPNEFVIGGPTSAMTTAAYPSGGAISAYCDGSSFVADRWTPEASAWASMSLETSACGVNLKAVTNAAGQAALVWTNATEDNDLIRVAFHDGDASWQSDQLTFAPLALLPDLRTWMLSTGEVVIAYGSRDENDEPQAYWTLFDPVAGAFSDPTIAPGFEYRDLWRGRALVDAQDRVTVAFVHDGRAYLRRMSGGSWGERVDLGPATDLVPPKLFTDPSGRVWALTYEPQYYRTQLVHATTADNDAFTAPVIGVPDQPVIGTALVFDIAGQPTVLWTIALGGDDGEGWGYSTCQLAD